MTAEIWSTAERGICFSHIGPLHVVVLGRRDWTDEEWRQFCLAGVDIARTRGAFAGSLTYAQSRGPTAAQRRVSAEVVPKDVMAAQRRIAMLSDSALMRTSMNAYGLLVRHVELKAFRVTQAQAAIAWLAAEITFDAADALHLLKRLLDHAGIDPGVLDEDWRARVKRGQEQP